MLTGDRSFYLAAALLCAAVAAWFSWLLTPLVRLLALRTGAVQQPRSRDVHVSPVPKLGGLAIYVSFLAALLIGALAMHFEAHKLLAGPALRKGIGVVLAGSLLSLLGAVDDRRELSAG